VSEGLCWPCPRAPTTLSTISSLTFLAGYRLRMSDPTLDWSSWLRTVSSSTRRANSSGSAPLSKRIDAASSTVLLMDILRRFAGSFEARNDVSISDCFYCYE